MRARLAASAEALVGRTDFQVALLCAAAALFLGFLAYPPINIDEGYFFQAGLHAAQTGKPGFPWADRVYGVWHVFIPFNALVSLLCWPLAYLPQLWWLIAGRLLSALAVCIGVVLLYRLQRWRPLGLQQAGVLLFLATCLSLFECGRLIRPDGVAFLFFCIALFLLFVRDEPPTLAVGITVALTILSHGVDGFLEAWIIAAVVAVLPAASLRARVGRLIAYVIGGTAPIVLFYSAYSLAEPPLTIWHDAEFLFAWAPRWVSSYAPLPNILAWFAFVRSQSSIWPMLAFAALAVLAPTDSSAPKIAAIRVLKVAIVAVMLFWIFLYAKKAYYIVAVLLPMAFVVLSAVSAPRWPRPVAWMLALCVLANSALVARYHWRLLFQPTAIQQIEPLTAALRREGLLRPHAVILAKRWLVFVLPRDVTLLDIDLLPLALAQRAGDQRVGIEQAVADSDGVVVDTERGEPLDAHQASIFAAAIDKGWRTIRVRTVRYFVPAEMDVLLPPNK